MKILDIAPTAIAAHPGAILMLDPDDLERLRNLLDWMTPEHRHPNGPGWGSEGLRRLSEIRDVVADAQRRMNADPEPDDDSDWTPLGFRELHGQPGDGQPSHPVHSTLPPPDSLFTGARGLTYWRSLEGRRQSDRNHHLPPQVD